MRFTVWADDHPSLHAAPKVDGRVRVAHLHAHQRAQTPSDICRSSTVAGTGHIISRPASSSRTRASLRRSGARRTREIVALLERPRHRLDRLTRKRLSSISFERLADQRDTATLGNASRPCCEALTDPAGNPEPWTQDRRPSERSWRPPCRRPRRSRCRAWTPIPRDIRIHVRGNHKNLGEPAPRRFLQVVAGENQVPFRNADQAASIWRSGPRAPSNPLTARVLVNRVWKHHFGRGIVARRPTTSARPARRPTHSGVARLASGGLHGARLVDQEPTPPHGSL